MVKIIKVSEWWDGDNIAEFIEELNDRDIDGLVIRDNELEVFDGELEKITIEGREVLEEERFSGDSLFKVR